jgi:cytochrome c oxidase subunit 4
MEHIHDDHLHASAAHHRRNYFMVFGVLMLGTIVTVFAAFHDLTYFGMSLNAPIALFIATFKAVCVILIFMHVKDSNRLTKITVFAAGFWLLILLTLTMSDFLSRNWH